ncbi:MAG TPA: hypothetical protein DDW76_32265 [Cyanobacteria bacterium UBA11369]|nr:hypothetical protein [Cyanobacteria bacterium UBA11371]HBE31302.1 hypothetical protein [Cyanobacteria bacterium UBA11368]HBE53307.1 hypothetical protein [Cyanobacteria bacterium UBA11369]
MHLLTLSDLKPTRSNEPVPLVSACIQERLQLLVKQMRMGLPVEPILNNYPQFQQWVWQLKELSPTLFMPRKKLLVDIPLTAKLELNIPTRKKSFSTPTLKIVEVRANVGIVRGKVRLFEWAIRHPILSWQDRVKLWVAAEYFNLQPDDLKLIVLALHPSQKAQKVSFSWDSKQHQQTRNWLIATIAQQTNQPFQPSIARSKTATATDNLADQPDDIELARSLAKTIDEIDEVSL